MMSGVPHHCHSYWLDTIVFASSSSYCDNFGGLTSGRYNISRPLSSLISCKLHAVVLVPGSSQHHQLVGGVAGVTFVGEWGTGDGMGLGVGPN